MIIFRTHRLQVAALGGAHGLLALNGIVGCFRDISRVRRVFAGMGAAYFVYQAAGFLRTASRKEALILGREGVLDRVGLPPAGFLPWEHIAAVQVLQLPVGPLLRKYVALQLDSTDALEVGRRRSALEPEILRGYAALIPEYAFEDRVEEVVETLNLYIEDAEERAELKSLLHAPGRPAW